MSARALFSSPVAVKPSLEAMRPKREELGWPGMTGVYMGTPEPTRISSMICLRLMRKLRAKRTSRIAKGLKTVPPWSLAV
jgi:hypothetical protein